MLNIKRKFFNWLYRIFPREMVSYWKTKEFVRAKVTQAPEGHYVMWMEGEKYPFPGFPRGHLLHGSLSKLKHEIKNQIFNDSWAKLENKEYDQKIIDDVKGKILDNICALTHEYRYDFLPPEHMVPPVKEIYRAWTVVESQVNPSHKEKMRLLKECLCFILQEDDAYRFRVQWLIPFFNPSLWWRKWRNPIHDFEMALSLLEHAEIVGDMKGRIRLLKRILTLLLKDETISTLFLNLCKELDWNKLKLTKADKYFFRGKWFKVDYPYLEY